MSLVSDNPAPCGGEEHQSVPTTISGKRNLAWTDLILLLVVLGTLLALIAYGVELGYAVTIIVLASLLTAEVRRRLS